MKNDISEYLILADCEPDEIQQIKECLDRESGRDFRIVVDRCNKYHGSLLKRIKRYMSYFSLPFGLVRRHGGRCRVVVGWQQFFALNYAFFYRLFGRRTDTKIFALNFTYKKKPGLVGAIYKRYMSYIAHCPALCLHVLSNGYADEMAAEFGIDRSRFMVSTFGTDDLYDDWKNLKCDYSDFALSIGRSNRDFDFLARVWATDEIQRTGYKLIVISDSWAPAADVQAIPNLIHFDNIKGEASYPYIVNCGFSIVTIDNQTICSGDTVLLNSMMCSRPVVVTAPSTLSEMYITDNGNGLYMPKDVEKAARIIASLITDTVKREQLGREARRTYLSSFTRRSMAESIAGEIVSRLRN